MLQIATFRDREGLRAMDKEKRAKKVVREDPQLDGGPDLDTTNLDRPSDLERPGGDLITSDDKEYGPLTVVPAEKDLPGPMDPSGSDPFIPGTAEAKDDYDPDQHMSDREKQTSERVHRKGANGPSYEANQGTAPQNKGGSTDPNNDLTESTSGLQKE